jgi:hypothetical protein
VSLSGLQREQNGNRVKKVKNGQNSFSGFDRLGSKIPPLKGGRNFDRLFDPVKGTGNFDPEGEAGWN